MSARMDFVTIASLPDHKEIDRSEAAIGKRRDAIYEAIAISRLEGFNPNEQYLALVEKFIAGDIDSDEFRIQGLALPNAQREGAA